MREYANAKLNLCLNVVGKREDGYHELEMIMVPLDLHDTLVVELAEETTLTSEVPLPMDRSNTIIKAIEVMRKHFRFTEQFAIQLTKRIPMQAGLAGGSSDGAAMLRCLNQLLNLNLSIEQLAQIGKEVGADVPFCVYNCPAIVKGIGEQVTPFHFPQEYHVLLIKPEQGVSTKEAFARLQFETMIHPDCEQLKEALLQQDHEKIQRSMQNTLEASAFEIVPVIRKIKQECLDYGFPYVLMSGSGSTVFALSESEDFVQQAYHSFKNQYDFVVKTRIKG
ncbi:MAG: 4-(cytidine 5'-diphospho)-2-C-methyl-D-erythritol kinase [Erysipelotrichaceae bacterium]|nr:4-(cytidine 5'-diphospho)-2-C-methyl-D-erythritol kinase [Erysipelotrichaceae bacterium]